MVIVLLAPFSSCAVKRRDPQQVKVPLGTSSLRPAAIGPVVELMKRLKSTVQRIATVPREFVVLTSRTLCRPRTGNAGADLPRIEGRPRLMEWYRAKGFLSVLPRYWRRHASNGDQTQHGKRSPSGDHCTASDRPGPMEGRCDLCHIA